MKKGKSGVIVLGVTVLLLLLAGGFFFVQRSATNKSFSLDTTDATPTAPEISLARRPTSSAKQISTKAKPTNGTPNAATPLANATGSSSPPSKPNGIYQFAGHNSTNNADKPYLQGTYLGYYWSQLEPQQGQYNWNAIDEDMKPWATNKKKVILRVATSGWTRWEPASGSGHATPQWVYDSGVRSMTEMDQSVHPEYWNPKFLAAYQSFVSALAQRYDGNPAIAVIEIGIGDGGETKVDTRRDNPQLLDQWQSIGYSDPIWWDTIQKVITIYTSNFHSTPLVILPDSSFIGKTGGYGESMLVDYATSHGLWLQDDGLATGRTLQASWLTVPRIEEQLVSTSQSGDSLHDDLQAALNLKATCVLIYADDINAPQNTTVLQQMDTLFLQNS
ncbi:MAG: beta-galactosidase [Ktedonobacteraceae bacterium]|nr:beta-galactosidase [Ktedonobacteraceae bacterium]